MHPVPPARERNMQFDTRPPHLDSVEARPVSELLACPPDTGNLLSACARSISFDAGQTIFRQAALCEGLYLVVSGQLVRRTERLDTRLVLGYARPGDLLELAAVLGDRMHTYSLIAQTPGSLVFLPLETLNQAFKTYPPLRMKLLEELAREVSRGYRACRISKMVHTRRRTPPLA
ncbi:cyclic nucleotide-binding domain-containing protein [Acidobacteria bacterium AB60]|nr:cyclic nucleotide-binding domain-containing protein [Acidobacteria bacterium AB60]